MCFRFQRFIYIYIYIYIYVYLSDERLGANLRVTENRCVLFNSLTYVKYKKKIIYI